MKLKEYVWDAWDKLDKIADQFDLSQHDSARLHTVVCYIVAAEMQMAAEEGKRRAVKDGF